MARSACEEFTGASWWALIEWLTDELHRRLGQLRRGRGVFADMGPFLFHGLAPGLECVGSHHYNPLGRPRAWMSVDVRLGEPVRIDDYGRSVWEREIILEARLPEAHQRKIVQDTDWWCAPEDDLPTPGAMDEEVRVPPPFDRKRRKVRLAPKVLHNQIRAHGLRRLRKQGWLPPLIAPRVWIDPRQTPCEVTAMALLLIFWQEGMVNFGPDDSPEAWAWAKAWTRSKDDARCWEIVTQMRQLYVEPEDWRALRVYLGKVCRGLRVPRGDAQDYAKPLRDEGDQSDDRGAEVS